MKRFIYRLLVNRPMRWLIISLAISGATAYLILFSIVGLHARALLHHPFTPRSDAALILGNRAYIDGALNPCLSGRVDKGLLLAKHGLVSMLVMSGGLDHEDNSIEAEAMATYAKNSGYQGRILLESRSRSTRENLEFSAPILKTAHAKNVIIVSEPYHLWRVEKLVAAGHLGRDFNVAYAAAPSQCWAQWGMLFIGALREPLAIMHNYAKGYFKHN